VCAEERSGTEEMGEREGGGKKITENTTLCGEKQKCIRFKPLKKTKHNCVETQQL